MCSAVFSNGHNCSHVVESIDVKGENCHHEEKRDWSTIGFSFRGPKHLLDLFEN